MSQNIPAELSIGYGLVALCQKIGARSSWLQYEQRLVDSNMPHAEQRLEKLTKTITKAQNDYQAVGRALETLFFGFGESYVVVVLEGDFAIGFLFPKELEEFNDSIVAGRRFLRTNRAKVFERLATEDASLRELHLEPEEHQQSSEPASEPQVNVAPETPHPWGVVEPILSELMGRLLPDAQVERLIERTLQKNGFTDQPTRELTLALSTEIINQVPHKGKRKALLAELSDEVAALDPTLFQTQQ